MNSKTCDNCGATAHDRQELNTWIEVRGKGGLFLGTDRVMDACSESCGLSTVAQLFRSRTENPLASVAGS